MLLTDRARRAFQVREVVVAPGTDRAFDDAEWRDALVVVEAGAIELESVGGARRLFVSGDVLWLAGLRLRLLRNRGPVPAVLSATSRRFSRPGPNSFPPIRV